MSFKVERLKVGKGKTTGDKEQGWTKRYFEVELRIEDPEDLVVAKANVEGLIDGWLTGETATAEEKPAETWNPSKITLSNTEGGSGPYERSEDVSNPEFKVMLKDLAAHKNKMRRSGFFYWVFQNGSTVGRKRVRK